VVFYAYKPTSTGQEPVGGDARIFWYHFTTVRGAVRAAIRLFGKECRVFVTGTKNIYDTAGYKQVYPGVEEKE